MPFQVDIDDLLAAAHAQLMDFKSIPASPVIVSDKSPVLNGASSEVIQRYTQFGFSVIQLESKPITAETALYLGDIFNLGEAFIPPLYLKGGYQASAVSKISTQDHDPAHPTFQREVEAKLHCDGTLQKIGYIQSSLLLCGLPAAEGGDSILFNATAAFSELLTSDLDAAIALATPGALVRQANINGCSDKNVGPVFAVQDGALVTAYSVTETDRFVAAHGINIADLRRGVEFMHQASQPGSPYFFQLRLEAGQAILFANSKLAHGRRPYRNAGCSRRCLYRSLYLKPPSLTVAPPMQKDAP